MKKKRNTVIGRKKQSNSGKKRNGWQLCVCIPPLQRC